MKFRIIEIFFILLMLNSVNGIVSANGMNLFLFYLMQIVLR